jgi:hypothetical protein
VTVDENNNVSGKASMQTYRGNIVSYTLIGSLKDTLYTLNIADRSDGKKGCVWSGRSVAHTDEKSHGLIGEVRCADNNDFVIRAGF